MSWQKSHTITVNVPLKKVWEFHSNIENNWKKIEGDSVEYIKLDGPYATGTKGETKMKGQPPQEWLLAEVIPMAKSITEVQLPEAKIHFEFMFERLSETETSMTQKISLFGEGADPFIPVMEENFGKNLVAGMKKVGREMEDYANE